MPRTDPGSPASALDIGDRLAELLDLTSASLVELDGEDIMLTDSANVCVKRTVEAMLRERPELVLAIFEVERWDSLFGGAFWVEETRDLVLCLNIRDAQRYLVFNERQWRMREATSH